MRHLLITPLVKELQCTRTINCYRHQRKPQEHANQARQRNCIFWSICRNLNTRSPPENSRCGSYYHGQMKHDTQGGCLSFMTKYLGAGYTAAWLVLRKTRYLSFLLPRPWQSSRGRTGRRLCSRRRCCTSPHRRPEDLHISIGSQSTHHTIEHTWYAT